MKFLRSNRFFEEIWLKPLKYKTLRRKFESTFNSKINLEDNFQLLDDIKFLAMKKLLKF